MHLGIAFLSIVDNSGAPPRDHFQLLLHKMERRKLTTLRPWSFAQNFHHEGRDLAVSVHGDDFTCTGSESALLWLKGIFEAAFEVKTEILGPEKRHVQGVKILNRIITWEKDGIMWEPDPLHAELIISQLGLDGVKPLKLPGVKEETRRSEKEVQELED